MNQKAAIVTGANSGIGLAIANYLATAGYELLLIARNEKTLAAVQNKLGANHTYAALDVADHAKVEAAINLFAKRFPQLDLLVNSAGTAKSGTSELSVDEFVHMLNTNLVGTFNLIHAVTPYMKKQGSGRIINIASRSGKVARATLGGYAASKYGVVGLNEALYKELATFGIYVTAICPAWVYTPMTGDLSIPKEQMISTDDIVKTVSYLLNLSPSAAIKEILLECQTWINETKH